MRAGWIRKWDLKPHTFWTHLDAIIFRPFQPIKSGDGSRGVEMSFYSHSAHYLVRVMKK